MVSLGFAAVVAEHQQCTTTYGTLSPGTGAWSTATMLTLRCVLPKLMVYTSCEGDLADPETPYSLKLMVGAVLATRWFSSTH